MKKKKKQLLNLKFQWAQVCEGTDITTLHKNLRKEAKMRESSWNCRDAHCQKGTAYAEIQPCPGLWQLSFPERRPGISGNSTVWEDLRITPDLRRWFTWIGRRNPEQKCESPGNVLASEATVTYSSSVPKVVLGECWKAKNVSTTSRCFVTLVRQ